MAKLLCCRIVWYLKPKYSFSHFISSGNRLPLNCIYIFIKQSTAFFMDVSELVKKARQGSHAAQKCLFDLWADKLLMICGRYVKNREDAEEIMLDGFYKFFKNLSSFNFQGDAALFAWIKKIMINECLMFLRKKTVFNIVSDSVAEEVSLEEEALNNLSAAEIFGLVIRLPVGYRTVFNLFEIEGMAHKEIASLLGISEGTSKSQLSKSKALLQKMLLQKGVNYVKQKSQ
jgi:RNA polymerase sigma-70 factor (ECF subfamily)